MGVRVHMGRIVGLTGVPSATEYGLWVGGGGIVVTNDAGTVIIDGTSNMFKIAASGTTSRIQPASDVGSTTVTITALGDANTETPAYLGYLSLSSDTTQPKINSPSGNLIDPTSFMAETSGGDTTNPAVRFRGWAFDETAIVAGEVTYTLNVANANTSSVTFHSKFYVLIEAAM